MKKKLLYREVDHNGGLVFATESEGRRVARIHHALKTARTWAEFRSLMPRKDYSAVVRTFDDMGESRPRGVDEFDAEQVPGWREGSYPTWLQQEMAHVLPSQVLEKYGSLQSTWVNGAYWHIPASQEAEVVEALTALGFKLEKVDNLYFW